jgi:hypothetical protein
MLFLIELMAMIRVTMQNVLCYSCSLDGTTETRSASTIATGDTGPANQGLYLPAIPSSMSYLDLPFRYGRKDAISCDDSLGSLPPANFTWAQTYELFGGRYGMSVAEVF